MLIRTIFDLTKTRKKNLVDTLVENQLDHQLKEHQKNKKKTKRFNCFKKTIKVIEIDILSVFLFL